jgi:hypothetical protein
MVRTSIPNRAVSILGRLLLLAVTVAAAVPVAAQEFTLFGGKTTAFNFAQSTYAWKLEYRQGLGEHFEFSYSWLNEGHIEGHHRDGHVAQLWARQGFLQRRLTLALGAGTMRFYDTQEGSTADSYSNVHGWAGIASFDAAYYLGKRWTSRLQVNRTWAPSTTIDTWDFLLGVGYQLTAPDEPGPRAWPERQEQPTTRNEITAFVGQTVVNSFNSQNSVSASLEYRRGLSQYFDVSASFLYEGNSQLVRRAGFIVQGWFGRSFFCDRLAISIGVGPYIAVDTYEQSASGEGSGTIAGMITPSVSYRFATHWLGRFSWNRTFTNYDKDTDVFQFGLGYRF